MRMLVVGQASMAREHHDIFASLESRCIITHATPRTRRATASRARVAAVGHDGRDDATLWMPGYLATLRGHMAPVPRDMGRHTHVSHDYYRPSRRAGSAAFQAARDMRRAGMEIIPETALAFSSRLGEFNARHVMIFGMMLPPAELA